MIDSHLMLGISYNPLVNRFQSYKKNNKNIIKLHFNEKNGYFKEKIYSLLNICFHLRD